MDRQNLRDSISVICGVQWLQRHRITDAIINDMIDDELMLLAGNLKALETDYTVTATDGQIYIDLPSNVMMIRNVWYDYTANSDWGTKLTEIHPSDMSGVVGDFPDYYSEMEVGSPTSYWLYGINLASGKKLYFNKKPDAVTIRIIYLKWPDTITDDTTAMEISMLWGKLIKHKIAMNLLANDPDRAMLYRHQEKLYQEAMVVGNEMAEQDHLNMRTGFTDA